MPLKGSANTDDVLQGNAETNNVLHGAVSGLSFVHGYSAYEIAVIHGFRGTEEEWLESLKSDSAKNGIPPGGKAGQILCKNSDNDFDVGWRDIEIPKQYGLVSYDQDKTITVT